MSDEMRLQIENVLMEFAHDHITFDQAVTALVALMTRRRE